MTASSKKETLWQCVSSGDRPLWVNAPDPIGFRSYGGSDAMMRIEAERLRLSVRSAKWFVVVFGCIFLPCFEVAVWFGVPNWNSKVFFLFLGPIAGGMAFGLIYGLLSFHERLGDYLIIDLATRSLHLPRCKVQFPLDQIFALQMITGRSSNSSDVQTDLNILVATDDGLVRFHIMGSPSRKQVEQLVEFAGLRVEEVRLGRKGFRDSDRNAA